MLVKNESASSSNNTSSSSSYDKLVCDNLSGSLTSNSTISNNNQSLSAFVVPLVGHRQNTESSSSLVPYDSSNSHGSNQRPNSNGSNSSSNYRSQKRRRLDTIISELNHCSTGSNATAATATASANGQQGGQVYQRRASLLNEKCLAECCANQVGDISSTTITSDRNARNFSSLLISRPIAIQLAAAAAAAAASQSSRKESHYQSILWPLGVDKSDNLAINLSCYDRQRENSNNCIRASASKLSQVTCPPRRAFHPLLMLLPNRCLSLHTFVEPMHTKAPKL